MADESEARKQFLSQRAEVLEQSRASKDTANDGDVSPFAAFANFENTEGSDMPSFVESETKPAVIGAAFEGPSDVTDATDLFFDAIVADPPPAAESTDEGSTAGETAAGNLSDMRHAQLLKEARKDQTAWVDKDSLQSSPPAPNLSKKVAHLDDLEDVFKTEVKVGGDTARAGKASPNAPGGAMRNLKPGTVKAAADVEGGKGILESTNRLFGFLNRFDTRPATSGADSKSESKKEGMKAPKKAKPFNYKVFKEKMKNPLASEIVKSVKSFVMGTMREHKDPAREPPAREDMGSRVRGFLKQTERRMQSSDHWKSEGEEEWENTVEGLEKFLMSKIYEVVFCPRDRDREADRELSRRIRTLGFVDFVHLDINGAETGPRMTATWTLAMSELRKMDSYKAPRDKMVCLLNCCKVISQLLNDARADADEKLPGADEFLPALIYVVLKANPENLRSNLEYIDCFRNPDKMLSEPGYWYTNLYSAVTFVENATYESLTITKGDFEAGMAKCQAGLDNDPVAAPPPASSRGGTAQASRAGATASAPRATAMYEERQVQFPHGPPRLSPKVQTKGADEIAAWKARRFRFMDYKIEDLKVLDVADLLAEYKNLAKSCASLLDERVKS